MTNRNLLEKVDCERIIIVIKDVRYYNKIQYILNWFVHVILCVLNFPLTSNFLFLVFDWFILKQPGIVSTLVFVHIRTAQPPLKCLNKSRIVVNANHFFFFYYQKWSTIQVLGNYRRPGINKFTQELIACIYWYSKTNIAKCVVNLNLNINSHPKISTYQCHCYNIYLINTNSIHETINVIDGTMNAIAY